MYPPASNFLLPDARLPSTSDLNIHPLELELMIMINEQIVPPIMYDRIMSWASKAVAMGYKFTSPQHKALLRRIESGFPKEHFGRDLFMSPLPAQGHSI